MLRLQRRGLPCDWNLQHSNADVATFLNSLTIQEREPNDPSNSYVDLTLQTLIPLQQTANKTLGVQDGKKKGSDKGIASHRRKDKLNLKACLDYFEMLFSKACSQSCRTGSLRLNSQRELGSDHSALHS